MKNNRRHNHNQQNPYNILPPTDVLEDYESIAPGSVEKLVKMAKKEQEHRHSWQEEHLYVHARIHRWGQIFAFIYNVLLLFLVAYLIEGGDDKIAIDLFIINAALMSFAILVTFIERRIMNRRPPRRFVKSKPSNNKGNSKNHSRRSR